MRSIVRPAVLLLLCCSSGCVYRYTLRPVSGGEVGFADRAGVELHADARAWNADPIDLPAYLTPIALRIVNRSDKPLAVDYGSFALVDDNGFRYAVVHPFGRPGRNSGRTEQYDSGGTPGRPPAADPDRQPEEPTEPEQEDQDDHDVEGNELHQTQSDWRQLIGSISFADDGSDADQQPLLRVSAERPRVAGRIVRRRGGGGGRGRVRVYRHRRYPRGFYVYPRSRVYVGGYYPAWPVWGGPVFPYYPGYASYVHVWRADPYPVPSDDVRRLALPEGVIEPGGQVSGFVYFQNASTNARRLELVWQARTPRGAEVATLRIPFVVQSL